MKKIWSLVPLILSHKESDSVGDNVESTTSQLTATSVHSLNLDPTSVNAGYKIVFDNLDKIVKPIDI